MVMNVVLHPPVSKTGYIPFLDGLRAVSIILVVLSHVGLERVIPGGLGVTVFFVLSGYLISKQLIEERLSEHTINLSLFYARRAARLLPALIGYVIIFYPLMMALGAKLPISHASAAILYYTNYSIIYGNTPTGDPLVALWSLAVEEHFYLAFPLLVLLCGRRLSTLLFFIIVLMASALVWRGFLSDYCNGADENWRVCGIHLPGVPRGLAEDRIYFGSDTRFDTILAGSLVVIYLRTGSEVWRRYLTSPIAFWIAVLVVLLSLLYRDESFREVVRYTMQSLAVAVCLCVLMAGKIRWLSALLSTGALTYIGRISYSIYLYHYGVVCVMQQLGIPVSPRYPLPALLLLLVSLALAMASYHGIERPFLKLRKRFGSTAAQA